MNCNEKLIAGTIDYYRQKAATEPDIAVLVAMIDRLKTQAVSALMAMIEKQDRLMEIEKIIARKGN